MFRLLPKMLTLALAALVCSGVLANENVYQTTLSSTAWIVTTKATGTGVLVDLDERLVVTNYHVIEGHEVATVYFPEQRAGRAVAEKGFYLKNKAVGINATVVASDKKRDIALLKLERIPDGIRPVEFGAPCVPGQNVHSIGNPGASGALWNYSFGKVRQNYYIETKYQFGTTQMQMLETTSPINHGDSGGPIVNDQGQLVGISQGFHKQHRSYSYGVDISEITWFLKQYRKADKRQTVSNDPNVSNPASDAEASRKPSANEPAQSNTADQSTRGGNFKDVPLFAAACQPGK